MLSDHLLYIVNNLKNRKIRSWLTMIGIFIGIASVVSLIGLGEGLRISITGQFGFLGSDVLSVRASGIDFAGPPGQAVTKPLNQDLAKKIARIAGVETAFDRHIESANVEFNDRLDIISIVSVPEKQDRDIFEAMINLKAEKGRLLKDGDTNKVVLGINFANDDIFGRSLEPGNKILINNKRFEVVGILEKKGNFIIDSIIMMNEETLKEQFDIEDTVDIIAVKVKDENLIPAVKENIEQLMRKERNVRKGEEDFNVQSPQATIQNLNDTLFGVQLFVYIIAFISLLVGGIGIANTMYTSVLERTKEIGIMKSIGATNPIIFSLFFIESGFLGIVGGIVGIVIGATLALGLAAAGRSLLGSELIQASITIPLIIGSILFSFIIGLFAGLIPAYQAARKNPVDALRFAK